MGNICHSGPVLRSDAPPPRPPPSSSPRKSLTFGRDPALKREDYIFSNARGPSCLIKQPGSINGQQFLLDGCADCDIFLLDNCTAVQIDDCTNCRIVVGPCDSSLFVRNCTNCTIVAAVQQFRTRDCDALDVFLYSVTEPVLELSTNVRVACFPLTYFSLQQQFDRAGFSVWNNRWSEIFNFTPEHGAWRPLSSSGGHESPLVSTMEMQQDGTMALWKLPSWTAEELGFTLDAAQLVVPLTSGGVARCEDVTGVVVVFPSPHTQLMLEFVQAMAMKAEGAEKPTLLIRTRQLKLTAPQAKALFPLDARAEQRAEEAAKATAGSVIMEFQGPSCETRVAAVLQTARFAGEPAATNAVVISEPHYRRVCELVFVEWKEAI